MTLEHVAIWTENLEMLKAFYIKYFGVISNDQYANNSYSFKSCFLTFESGARLALMTMPGIPDNANDTVNKQHKGIIRLAFGVETISQVDAAADKLKDDGFQILRGPRKTGDGYYEFETLDPDNNRLEVTCLYPGRGSISGKE
ncbi:MAG: VOC family protein [Ginsengibacter sp.]